MRVNKVIIKISVVSILSILIWRFALYLNAVFAGAEYDRTTHFIMALVIAILSFILINTARKKDKISWKQIGMSRLRTNTISFLVGTATWAIPASIGLVISLMAGWAEITITTDLSKLILSVVILYIIIFLVEAFPEELIFRGYIYSYLNTLFPHWLVLIMQTLIFTLFAYFIGAMYSFEQIMFIPGFGFMLGYFRAKSGNVWTTIGFHAAIMTASQILSPIHGNFDVSGIFAVRFFAFNLLPYVLGAIALDYIYPKHNWSEKMGE